MPQRTIAEFLKGGTLFVKQMERGIFVNPIPATFELGQSQFTAEIIPCFMRIMNILNV
jgi:hypothetical protein